MSKLPDNFFNPLIEKACELISPQKIILYGSFARGDQQEKSDIDLAFEFDSDFDNWILFKAWVEDEFKTLRHLDLIDMKKADESLLASIKKEGVIIYER